MPSPFPGMDPYLESPEHWRGFHSAMIPALNAQLNRTLPDGFAAFIEERIYVIGPESQFIPDMVVVARNPAKVQQSGTSELLERSADASETVTYFPDQARELFIEVRRSGDRVSEIISTVELLSPSNKALGSKGHEEYKSKQLALLAGPTHLLEIDLLRAGAHTIAPPGPVVHARGDWDYVASLHRADRPSEFEIWRILLANRLPRVKVSLTVGYEDAVLDLQEAFDAAYDAGPYRRVVDYTRQPDPPLSTQLAQWADALLRKQGVR
jgi:hypothetical protein